MDAYVFGDHRGEATAQRELVSLPVSSIAGAMPSFAPAPAIMPPAVPPQPAHPSPIGAAGRAPARTLWPDRMARGATRIAAALLRIVAMPPCAHAAPGEDLCDACAWSREI